MRFAIYLVIAGVFAAAAASLPARGRTAFRQDTCFSDSASLRLDPSRADARGTANYSAGQYQAAAADFSKAIDLGYADATVFYLRELAESELGHRSDAGSE